MVMSMRILGHGQGEPGEMSSAISAGRLLGKSRRSWVGSVVTAVGAVTRPAVGARLRRTRKRESLMRLCIGVLECAAQEK